MRCVRAVSRSGLDRGCLTEATHAEHTRNGGTPYNLYEVAAQHINGHDRMPKLYNQRCERAFRLASLINCRGRVRAAYRGTCYRDTTKSLTPDIRSLRGARSGTFREQVTICHSKDFSRWQQSGAAHHC